MCRMSVVCVRAPIVTLMMKVVVAVVLVVVVKEGGGGIFIVVQDIIFTIASGHGCGGKSTVTDSPNKKSSQKSSIFKNFPAFGRTKSIRGQPPRGYPP